MGKEKMGKAGSWMEMEGAEMQERKGREKVKE